VCRCSNSSRASATRSKGYVAAIGMSIAVEATRLAISEAWNATRSSSGHPTTNQHRTGCMTIDTVRQRLQVGPSSDRKTAGRAATLAFVAGGLLIIWSSYIHFHLWQSLGYRHIATIGPLFLLQSIGGLLLGLVVIAARRVWAAALGAGFAVFTMIGFLVSVEHGLFGFKDTWSAPFAHEAFALEIAIIGVCVFAGALCLMGSASESKNRHIFIGVLSIAGLLVLGGAVLLATDGGGAGPSNATASQSGGTSTAAASSVHITISNFMFQAMSVTVKPGATVTVTNKDSATHTLTATGGQFDTGNIVQNQTKTFKAPMKPGTYDYICNIHQYMTGNIIVG
jgi:plastocyanin